MAKSTFKENFRESWAALKRFFKSPSERRAMWNEGIENFSQTNFGESLNSLANKFTGYDITNADKIQNEFNANEAALQRDWSAAEAERARDWNEEMYEKYNSLSGKIAQAEQAGVNPMLAVTGQAVSPVSASASAPSGASASGGSPTSDSFVNLVGQLAGLVKLKSEINLNDANAEAKRAEAENSGADTALKQRTLKIMTEHNLDVREIESRINLNTDQATMAFAYAEKAIEECARITQEKDFFESTKDDQAKIIEYNKLMAKFDAGLTEALDNLSAEQKSDLSSWVGAIFKSLLLINKK